MTPTLLPPERIAEIEKRHIDNGGNDIEWVPGAGFVLEAFDATYDDRAALLSHIRALEEEAKWRPIETAPKDGTPVLLFFPAGPHHGGAIEGWWFSSPKEIDDGWETIIGTIGEPTHWRPLPDPPEGEKK